jgi:hypothetical protein
MVVTEYDLVCNDDTLHADYLRDILILTFSHPKMTGFINWGFWAGLHWKPEGALIRKDWTERPAVTVWRDLVTGAWWTTADIQTDTAGAATIDGAFYGTYTVTVSHGGLKAQTHPSLGQRPRSGMETIRTLKAYLNRLCPSALKYALSVQLPIFAVPRALLQVRFRLPFGAC